MGETLFKTDDLKNQIKTALYSKYYTIFMNSLECDEIEPEALDYVARKFWKHGKICAFNMLGDLAFATFAPYSYGLYDVPKEIQLINERNIPEIPSKLMHNNKDCVIGYYSKNKQPVEFLINNHIDRMVNLLMAIAINVETSKVPFILGTDPEDYDIMKDFIYKIVRNDLAIFITTEQLQSLKMFNTSSSYIIDKLWLQYQNEESMLLTQMGIDCNSINFARSTTDQTNANNQLINSYIKGCNYALSSFNKKIKEVLGFDVNFKRSEELIESIHEDKEVKEDEFTANNE